MNSEVRAALRSSVSRREWKCTNRKSPATASGRRTPPADADVQTIHQNHRTLPIPAAVHLCSPYRPGAVFAGGISVKSNLPTRTRQNRSPETSGQQPGGWRWKKERAFRPGSPTSRRPASRDETQFSRAEGAEGVEGAEPRFPEII